MWETPSMAATVVSRVVRCTMDTSCQRPYSWRKKIIVILDEPSQRQLPPTQIKPAAPGCHPHLHQLHLPNLHQPPPPRPQSIPPRSPVPSAPPWRWFMSSFCFYVRFQLFRAGGVDWGIRSPWWPCNQCFHFFGMSPTKLGG